LERLASLVVYLAYVYVSQKKPRIDDARRLFGHVFTMKFEPEIEHLRKWFMAERFSGHGMQCCLDIADFVNRAKTYDEDVKVEFLSRKGTQLYNRGRNDLSFSPDTAIEDLAEALRLHLICYSADLLAGSIKVDTAEKYARNTAFFTACAPTASVGFAQMSRRRQQDGGMRCDDSGS
jgi:hypothetical protein